MNQKLPAKEFEVPFSWGKVRGKLWGNPKSSAPKVLALHGWLDSAASFDSIAPTLGDQLIAVPDLPGHGLSDPLPDGLNYHTIDLVDHVLSIAAALGWDSFNLVGHSMGAAASALIAATSPRKILKLVLIDAIGPLGTRAEKSAERLRKHVEALHALRSKPATFYPSVEKAIEARMKHSVVGELSRDACELLGSRGLRQTDLGWRWVADRRLMIPTPSGFTEEQVLSFLKEIQCPTLFIRANPGMRIDAESFATRCAAVKNLQKEELNGGHYIHLEQPNQVGALIRKFLLSDLLP